MLRMHRKKRAAGRILVGAAFSDPGLVSCRPDGEPLDPGGVTEALHRAVARPGLRPVRLHDLRHAYATLAFAAGASLRDVQEHLGNKNVATTLAYPHPSSESRRALIDGVAALVGQQ